MGAWRALAVVAAGLCMAVAATAQTATLTENLKADECFRVRIDMSLTGDMRVSGDGKPVALSETATASHEFAERILLLDKAGIPEKSVRRYATAKATITVGR